MTRVGFSVLTLDPDQGNKSPYGNLKIGEVYRLMFEAEFEEWWKAYPKRVGRIAAKAAYTKARKGGVPSEVLLDGIAAYRRMKPSYADWCHPTTWLNQGRWMDEPAEAERRRCPRCGGEPPCRSYTQCNERLFPHRKASA